MSPCVWGKFKFEYPIAVLVMFTTFQRPPRVVSPFPSSPIMRWQWSHVYLTPTGRCERSHVYFTPIVHWRRSHAYLTPIVRWQRYNVYLDFSTRHTATKGLQQLWLLRLQSLWCDCLTEHCQLAPCCFVNKVYYLFKGLLWNVTFANIKALTNSYSQFKQSTEFKHSIKIFVVCNSTFNP